MKKSVSFDFDSTLSRPDVQKFAKELIDSGIDVWICTTRHSSTPMPLGMSVVKDSWNDDLFEISDSLGIPRTQILFTCGDDKHKHLYTSWFIFHLDDDMHEVTTLNKFTQVKGICVFNNPDWKEQCMELLS